MKINSYKDLEAYKKGSELVKVIYEIMKIFPKNESDFNKVNRYTLNATR